MNVRNRYLLTLSRQGIFESNDAISGEESYFAMDYFDNLNVKVVNANDGLGTFMGMEKDISKHVPEIAIQNYAIYSDKYSQKECDEVFWGEAGCYLSLIHVYITPDALVGIGREYLNKDYITYFEEDLQNILQAFQSERESQGAVFRMLSVCDFMIVLRSNTPEVVFELSTQIRKHMICKRNQEKESLVAYKTYTILTIGGKFVEVDSNTLSKGNNCFAIRGRYSNKYWKEKSENIISMVAPPDDIIYLHGRYDFLILLSSTEFESLRPFLMQVKGMGESRYIAEDILEEKTLSIKCRYLYRLLKKRHLSYLNERYLVNPQIEENGVLELKNNYMKKIYLDGTYKVTNFTYEIIQNKCAEVMAKIDNIKNMCCSELYYHKFLHDSLDMLRELAHLCESINSLADVRIYAIALLEQLKVVCFSVEEWLKTYLREMDADLLTKLEVYLRQAVVTLEAYGSIVRGNNFQTLQAPRYNVVSGCSIEKILIGYSRFLNSMMKFCYENNEYGPNTKYLPVMVPDLKVSSLSVEILFPNWFLEEDNVVSNLMVATGPASKDLVDVSYIVTTLFHELAHNIRYESRTDRNKILFNLLLENCADAITRYFFENVVDTKIKHTFSAAMYGIFVDMLKEGFCKDLEGMEFDCSLSNFREKFQAALDTELKGLLSEKSVLEMELENFIKDTNEYIVFDKMKELNEIYVNLNRILNLSEEEISDKEKKLKDGLEDAVKKYVNSCIIEYEKDEQELSEEDKIALNNMERTIRGVIRRHNIKNYKRNPNRQDDFWRRFYERLCDKWEKSLEVFTFDKKEWLRLGRKLGLDCNVEENFDCFKKMILKAVKMTENYRFESAFQTLEIYREETSDLFMCNMCNLSALDYLIISIHTYPEVNQMIPEGHVNRIADILLVQFAMTDIENTREEITAGIEQLFNEIYRKLRSEEDDHIIDIKNLPRCYLSYINEATYPYLKRQIASVSLQIFRVIFERLDWLQKRKFLKDDFFKGKKVYRELFEEFKNNKGHDIKSIKNMCDANKRYLERFCSDTGGDYYKACEDFFMSMYCYDKLAYAIEGGNGNGN